MNEALNLIRALNSTLLTTWALVLQPLACLLGHGYVRDRISSAARGDASTKS